jgi:hypothetical protein
MRTIGLLTAALTLASIAGAAGAREEGAAIEGAGVEGYWQGDIDVGTTTIDVEVHFQSSEEAGLTGAVSFPSQGDYDVGVEILDNETPAIRFTIPGVAGAAVFDGTLAEDGESIAGTFSQHGRSYPFELERGEAPTPEAAIDPEVAARMVDDIAKQLTEGYIYEDAGKKIAKGLRKAQAAGKLGEGSTAPALAQALTAELQALSNDIHLRVEYRAGRPGRQAAEDSSGGEPAAREAHGPGSSGIGGHQIFDDNIGYLNMVHFGGGDGAAAELDKVLAELAGVRALIIDLRENLGGGPFMVRYLSTYLFAERTHLASRVGRNMPEPAERWTFETTRGERMADIPVVLLISNTTVSAGESFAFGLRNNGRVTIVGERTAGGGHFGDMVDLGDGFSMFLPIGKTINPKTGEGWEAEGLAPDVEIEADFALEAVVDRLNAAGSE